MKIKTPFKAIVCSLAILTFLNSCQQDNDTVNPQEGQLMQKKVSRKIEPATANGKSVIKITIGNKVEYFDSYLNKDNNTLFTNVNNKLIVTRLDNKNKNTAKSGYQVSIDSDLYMGDGFMMHACKGILPDFELIDVLGELWIREGQLTYKAGSVYYIGLNDEELEYFRCLEEYDPVGVIHVYVG
ncbi:hypothetical protein [Chryseobacterium jejuense]|uniref:Lipoprotein n=1 Tax=Chryseobacterium jejuense TaxID=445960 RepID=A0A2X2V862_CHRJE|nr:hypothetical protein [Chryseobacterium jejuense]SDI40215.1 hypothetical protein SAMN05421542_1104 [Chryseobacterium jejuense]SQB26962.1 Uncharacterised protein [Chryseobacterium jejuense]